MNETSQQNDIISTLANRFESEIVANSGNPAMWCAVSQELNARIIRRAISMSKACASDCDYLTVDRAIRGYVESNNKRFSKFSAHHRWTTEPKDEVLGRYSRERNGEQSLALASSKLTQYLDGRGIQRKELQNWVEARGGELNRMVRLAPGLEPIRCVAFPVHTI